MVLCLPPLVLLSWALGLGGAVVVGVLNVPIQMALLSQTGVEWDSVREVGWLVNGSALAACLGIGLFRFQFDRRLQAEKAMLESRYQAERRAMELSLLSTVRDRLARDMEPSALIQGVVDALAEDPRYATVAAYQPEGENLVLASAAGKQTLPDNFAVTHDTLSRVARTAESLIAVGPEGMPEMLGGQGLVAVPVLVKGAVRGILVVAGQPGELGEKDLHFLEEVSAQLSMALDRARVYEALREQESLYRTLMETLPDVVALFDGTQVLYLNPIGLRGLGYRHLEEVVGRPLIHFIHPDSFPRVAERLQRVLAGERDVIEEIKVLAKNGEEIEVEAYGVLVHIAGAKQVMVTIRDVGERKRQQARIEYLAYHDPLTDLPNRRKLWEAAESIFVSDRRRRDTPALIYLDLDNFKIVNDTLGHQAGDELLRQVAQRMKEELRQGDILARLGGDEFAVLLSSVDRNTAVAAARRILGVFNLPFVLGDHSLHAQASLGVALYPEHGSSLDELARAADVAMYQAKHDRAGIAIYDPDQDRNSLERLQLIQELRKTIQGGSFLIQYQPILNIGERYVSKWEALVRWAHPERGLLRPGEFVPLAEEAGIIGELDLAVLRQAVRDHHRLGGELTINFSAATLAHPNWVREVVRALVDEGMQPGRLWLEITESALLPERQRWLAGLVALRGLGVRVALDDFGMGYSSLSHLRQVPVDLIKIDKTFTAGIGQGDVSEEILQAILQLAGAFGLKTLAEGVENRSQLDWLARNGCNYAQGYYVGLPMGPDQAVEDALTRVF